MSATVDNQSKTNNDVFTESTILFIYVGPDSRKIFEINLHFVFLLDRTYKNDLPLSRVGLSAVFLKDSLGYEIYVYTKKTSDIWPICYKWKFFLCPESFKQKISLNHLHASCTVSTFIFGNYENLIWWRLIRIFRLRKQSEFELEITRRVVSSKSFYSRLFIHDFFYLRNKTMTGILTVISWILYKFVEQK